MRDSGYSRGRRSRSRSPRRRSRSPGRGSVSSRLTAKKFSPPRMRSDDAGSKPSLTSRLRPSSRDRKRRDRRGPSASPSPPRSRPRRDSPVGRRDENFRITVSTAPAAANPKSAISERERRAFLEMRQRDLTSTEKPKYPALGSRTKDERGQIFRGPEFGDIDGKEQRKIQIDIRRNIPSHRVSQSPIRRSIEDANSIVVSRSKDEGFRPVFNRDEINDWLPRVAEQRCINIVGKEGESRRFRTPSPSRRRNRSRSPLAGDIRSRLGRVDDGRDDRRDGRREDSHRNGSGNVRDRLGDRRGEPMDQDRVLNREELEMQRPDVKPWDINPEFVPRGRNYFEHDNRESFEPNPAFRGRGGFRGRGIGRGGRGFHRQSWGNYDNRRDRDDFRPRGDFGRYSRGAGRGRRGRDPSPEWKHDKFDDVKDDE